MMVYFLKNNSILVLESGYNIPEEFNLFLYLILKLFCIFLIIFINFFHLSSHIVTKVYPKSYIFCSFNKVFLYSSPNVILHTAL